MENQKSSIEIIDTAISILTQLPNVDKDRYTIQNLNFGIFGEGQDGYNLLKKELDKLYLPNPPESITLETIIPQQEKESKELENKHINLTEIIRDSIDGKKYSATSRLLSTLNYEIKNLTEKKNGLKASFTKSMVENDTRIDKAKLDANKKIKDEEDNANGKVKLIKQFRDFLEETNKNMRLYYQVIIGLLIAAILAIVFSIPNLLEAFESYDAFIKTGGTEITSWQILNYALGLLIVKLPWALCLSAVLTGMYSLLKGLLLTYEKINQDKRNMSAIYAISGNVAEALNEYGLTLQQYDSENQETGLSETVIMVRRKELSQKKEDIKWNLIMRYFEGMQQQKAEFTDTESNSKLFNLLEKTIDKLPKI